MNKRRKVIHGIKLTICEACGASFRVKKFNKPYIGMFKGKPVFHWHYTCVSCGYKHTVRFYNEFVNTYYDQVKILDWSLMLYKNDKDKFKELTRQYKIAKEKLHKANDEIIKTCLTKSCS